MRPRVTVCGLGPGGPGQLTEATIEALGGATTRFLRTSRHPTAARFEGAATFDHLYESADSFADVYHEIAEAVVGAAESVVGLEGSVVYAVPGSPLVLENSVQRLLADGRVDVELVPALSFLDEVWARLAIDPIEASVRLVDGHQFATQAAAERGPMVVAHVHDRFVLSDIKLAIDAGSEQRAIVLQRLGTADEHVVEVAWPDLDRVVDPDHLTTLYLPEVVAPVGRELIGSVELMRRLRRDCPWDREQDHSTLRRYLVEESYEVLEALDRVVDAGSGSGAPDDAVLDDAYLELEEELGDLWFQILFHAELAGEAGRFTIADVAASLHEKMVRRHPHVFSEAEVTEMEQLAANWDRIKGDEKGRSSSLDGIPGGLPALALAAKTLQRASRAGASTDFGGIGPTVDGLLPAELDGPGFGRLFFALVDDAGRRGIDPEDALRQAVRAAADRYRSEEAVGAVPGPAWVLG